MPPTLLFLLGGNKVLDAVAGEFVMAAGGSRSRIALLLMGGRGWEKHLPEYVDPWMRRGAGEPVAIVPGEGGALDVAAAAATLREATGIFIGGGHTPTYHRLYATEPMRGLIRERFHAGIPVAGLSAGALIACEVCALRPGERQEQAPAPRGSSLKIVDGLALVRDLLVEVHFTERNALAELREAMAKTRMGGGLGIDETACAVIENGRLKRLLGRSVYEIVMTDFETKTHQRTEVI